MPKPPQGPVSDEALLSAARAAATNAYCPYSGLRVGAALSTPDGRVFSGCNVENASYGLTICAERSAICSAVAQGVRSFQTIVVVSNREAPLMPCGACRQALLEFGPSLRVLCVGSSGDRVELALSDLLPRAFDGADLVDELPRDGGKRS